MNLRPFIVTVALLSSALVLAQGRTDKPRLDKQLKQTITISAESQETYTSSPINTEMMFPQISNFIGSKIIKPENPTLGLKIRDVFLVPVYRSPKTDLRDRCFRIVV